MKDPHYLSPAPTRRELLQALVNISLISISGCGGDQGGQAATTPAQYANGATAVRLSRQASNRGSAYLHGNKVLALPEGGTLVTYLESDGQQVTVILEQLDERLFSIRRMIVGIATDNHGGAAIALDSQQRLHIVYGPHGGPIKYRRSQFAKAFFDLNAEEKFGGMLTYPSLMVDRNDRLWVAAREGSGEQGAKGTVEIWATDVQGKFQRVATPLINREVGYAAFNPSLHIDSTGRLHLTATIHEGTDELIYGRYQAVTYLTSDDEGKTWKNASQEVLTLPATIIEAGAIYEGGMSVNRVVSGGVVTTDASGQVLAHFHVEWVDQNRSSLMLARLKQGVWVLDDLRQICEVPSSYEFSDPGTMCVIGNVVTFASVMQSVTLADRSPYHGTAWGHPSNRVAIGRFNLSNGTGQFTLLPTDAGLAGPYWLPNI